MSNKELRIVFMGTPDFAAESLRRLVECGYNIVGVVTMPDKPAGRGLKLQQSAVKRLATEKGLKVLQSERLKDPHFVEEFRSLNAELGIVIAFRMLPEIIWSQPRLGTFNLHASLLPQYRGAAPINWAIMNGEMKTGVTTFFLNSEIDKGDIIDHREIEITNEDNVGTLHDKLMYEGAGLVLDTVDKIASGNMQPLSQQEHTTELKIAPKIFKDDCRIEWNRRPNELHNFIRGLSPYPAAWSTLKTENDHEDAITIKVFISHPEFGIHDNRPGEIFSDGRTFLNVACKSGYIAIDELQLAGKKRMTAEEFLRGFKDIGNYHLL